MTTLATFRPRVAQILRDAAGRIYLDAALDEAIRQALDAYSLACPLEAETILTLERAGTEIDLSGVTGLLDVLSAVWPYDPAYPAWAGNRVRAWRLYRLGGPSLLLTTAGAFGGGATPQPGDRLRLVYTARHWLEGLDGAPAPSPEAPATTLPAEHESLLALGAAGYAAAARIPDLAHAANPLADQFSALERWGYARMEAFLGELETLREAAARRGPSWAAPWSLDRWDGEADGDGDGAFGDGPLGGEG